MCTHHSKDCSWADVVQATAARLPRAQHMWIIALTLATASQSGGPVAPLPTGSHFGLWSLTTGELLQHSATPPLHTRFGPRPHNVTGALVKPPLKGLCAWRQEMSAWRGSVVLCGDWTFPGCSIEERSRVLTAAGVAAAVFMGTEGLPLDWDGSSYDSIGIPAIVIGPVLYDRVLSAVESNDPSDYMVWLAPQDSPLLHDHSFMLFDRTMQIVFFCAAAANICLAIYQLINIRTAAKALERSSKKLKMDAANRVISLELVSALGMTLYIVDGPGMEHTRPVVLPWLVHRLALGIQVEFHMLALLVSSLHLRQIRKRVEDTTSPKKRGSGSWRSATSRSSSSIHIGDVPDGGTKEGQSCGCAVPASSRYDRIFVVIIVGLVIVDLVIAILTGLYIATDEFTIVAITYVCLVTFGLGFWFFWQAMVITRVLKETDIQLGKQMRHRRVSRLSRHAMRIGILMFISAVCAHGDASPCQGLC